MTSINGEIDQYGFERAEDFDYESYEKFMAEYLSVLARRLAKWEKMLNGTNDVSRSTRVKRYIRKGIPSEHRCEIWMATSKAQEMKDQSPNKYNQLVSEPTAELKVKDSIKIDIRRTYPENVFFKEIQDSLLDPLANVLTAFASYNTKVGYCQGLNYIAGMLLLITKNEENAFWLLVELVENIVPDFYSTHMLGLRIECKVLQKMINLLAPDLSQHFAQNKIDMELLASKWFVCLFTDVLPVETQLRVWDCLFYEGSKVILRAALTIILMNKEKFLAQTDFALLCNIFKEIIHDENALNCHNFMQQCFILPKSLSRAKIQKLREEARLEIEAEKR